MAKKNQIPWIKQYTTMLDESPWNVLLLNHDGIDCFFVFQKAQFLAAKADENGHIFAQNCTDVNNLRASVCNLRTKRVHDLQKIFYGNMRISPAKFERILQTLIDCNLLYYDNGILTVTDFSYMDEYHEKAERLAKDARRKQAGTEQAGNKTNPAEPF